MHRNFVPPHGNRSCLLPPEWALRFTRSTCSTTTNRPPLPNHALFEFAHSSAGLRNFVSEIFASEPGKRKMTCHVLCEEQQQCIDIVKKGHNVAILGQVSGSYIKIITIIITIIIIIIKDTRVVNSNIKTIAFYFLWFYKVAYTYVMIVIFFFILCVLISKSKFKLFTASPNKKVTHYGVIILRNVNQHGENSYLITIFLWPMCLQRRCDLCAIKCGQQAYEVLIGVSVRVRASIYLIHQFF